MMGLRDERGSKSQNKPVFVGLDVGSSFVHWAVLDEKGTVQMTIVGGGIVYKK